MFFPPRLILSFIALIAVSATANAMQVSKFLAMMAASPDKELVTEYLNGVGEGFGWANVQMAFQNKGRLFCTPSTLALNEDNYLRILNDEIAFNSKILTAEHLVSRPN